MLATEILGNSTLTIASAIVVFAALLGFLKIFRTKFLTKLETITKKTETEIDDRLIKMIENISSLFYWFLAFYMTIKIVGLVTKLEFILDGIFLVLVVWEVLKIAQNLIEYALKKTSAGKDETVLHGLNLIIKIILWSTGLLLILSNLGFNISAIAASMGIGGIAIALAAQNILGDLFSSFSIYFDKPFRLGDFIVVGTDKGIVKKIGLKTTRIETIQGEELVISNKELTEARIQNYKKMKRRRISFKFGVIYSTPLSKLQKIPGIVTGIIEKQELATPQRAHFREFGDFSLNFEINYYVESQDFDDYLNIQQNINFEIKRAFEKEEIEMAFPTQTLFVKKD